MTSGWRYVLVLALASTAVPWTTARAQNTSELEACLLDKLRAAPGSTTVSELRQACSKDLAVAAAGAEVPASQTAPEPATAAPGAATAESQAVVEPEPTPLEQRRSSELALRDNPFAITAHRPNYFLVGVYSNNTYPGAFQEQFNDPDIDEDHYEARFQISIKSALAEGLLGGRADLLAGYTNRSFWQLYNKDVSAPFRETNHEPEAWLSFANDWELFGWRNANNSVGLVHQSNGQGGELSRSWNRVFANLVFERGDLAISVKPWWRIPESDEDDDNPDITDYLGDGEIVAAWTQDRHTFSILLRNHLESGFSKGTTEISWSFPLGDYPYLKGYLQLFNGYGVSLIDYNRQNTSLGIGVSLNDWL